MELNWTDEYQLAKALYYFFLSISSMVGVNVCYKNIHIFSHSHMSTHRPLPLILLLVTFQSFYFRASDQMAGS